MTKKEIATNNKLHQAVNIINDFYKDGFSWHPDDDFLDYCDGHGNPIDNALAYELNAKLDKLWKLCNDVDVNIYDLAICFNNRDYDVVTSYIHDDMVYVGMKSKKPFEINGMKSERLLDGLQTLYIIL